MGAYAKDVYLCCAMIMQNRGDMLRYGDDCLPLLLCHVLLFQC